MKHLVLYASVLLLTLTSCKTKYPDLEPGLYAEFETNKGTFVAKFYHEATPLTVANFVALSKGTHPRVDSMYQGKPYFNGLTFHRVIKDFMIQGGDPKGDGTGNPGYAFPDEIVDSLSHRGKGILSMANSGPATNGSQFFITLKETPWLNGKHTVFGEIVLGQDVVDSIGSVTTSKPGDKPVYPVYINSVSIINKGVEEPSFEVELERIEQVKAEKQARIAMVAAQKKAEFDALATEAQAYPSGIEIYWNHKGKGMKPAEGTKVLLDYAGYFSDGNLLDTSIQAVAEQFESLNAQRAANNQYVPLPSAYSKDAGLIPGFKEAMFEMSYGDKLTVFIPSHLAWGAQGAGNVIPPNSDVIFEIELVGPVE